MLCFFLVRFDYGLAIAAGTVSFLRGKRRVAMNFTPSFFVKTVFRLAGPDGFAHMRFIDLVSKYCSQPEHCVSVDDADIEVAELFSSLDHSSQRHGAFSSPTTTELEVEITPQITLVAQQNPQLNSTRGITGAVVWDSGVLLARFLGQLYSAVDENASGAFASIDSCVELGAGCGLAGMACHRLGARKVVLTDQQCMQRVVERNIEAMTSSSTRHKAKKNAISLGSIRAGVLDWTESKVLHTKMRKQRSMAQHELQRPLLFDDIPLPAELVVASDCVYNDSIVDAFLATVDYLTDQEHCEDAGLGSVFIIAQELRSEVVHGMFVEGLLELGFELWRLNDKIVHSLAPSPNSSSSSSFVVIYIAIRQTSLT